MRNYIKLWFAAEYVTYHTEFGNTNTTEYQIGADADECLANIDFDRQQQLNQNQFQPPGRFYTFDADEPTPRYFEMNKDNIMQIIDPFEVAFDTDLFVTESPRESWSHGH